MEIICTVEDIIKVTSIYISQVSDVNGCRIVLHVLNGDIIFSSPIHTCCFYFVFTYLFFFLEHRLFFFYILIQGLYIVHLFIDVNGVEQ